MFLLNGAIKFVQLFLFTEYHAHEIHIFAWGQPFKVTAPLIPCSPAAPTLLV